MNGLTLLALLAPAAAFQLASPAHFRPRAAIRMQEEEAAPVEEAAAVPESSGPLDRTSPLAGVVGETNLKSFEEKKAEDNAKRLALRERINIGLPAAFFSHRCGFLYLLRPFGTQFVRCGAANLLLLYP